jgi:adenosylcobinamide-phosphate synthase
VIPLTSATLTLPLIATLATAGVAVDRWFGEPRGAHPLVAFGNLAKRIEARLNTGRRGRLLGLLAWALAVLPPVLIAAWLIAVLPFTLACAVHVVLLWFALGGRSLDDHIAPIACALVQRNLVEARLLTARIVSRETAHADEAALSRAAVESALENGNDAIFGALFWFAIAGGPGALAFRLANTLDAMWGYRTPRYLRFGWAAARIDDVLNWIPARLTAASYALLGDTRTALRCWREQAPRWDSPNAGPVMAAGAGSLNVLLGGAAVYHGVVEPRPTLGAGEPASAVHVIAALQLVQRTVFLWLAVLIVLALLSVPFHG